MGFRALTRVNFELGGGVRQNVAVAVAFVMLVVVITAIARSAAGPQDVRGVDVAMLTIVSIAQLGFVLLIAPGAIHKAVQRDIQTGLLDSHRLTPLTGLQLALGYLTGPTAQAALLFGTGLLLGGYFVFAYAQYWGIVASAVPAWFAGMAGALPLAFLVANTVLLTSLLSRGKINLLLFFILFGIVGGWVVIRVVPGLALMFGVLTLFVLLDRMGAPALAGLDANVYAWTVLLQLALALTLLAANSRKLRYPHRPAFSFGLGLILLLLSGLALLVGLQYALAAARWGGPFDETAGSWQWLCSVITIALVAMVPLSAAATARAAAERRAAPESRPAGLWCRLPDLAPWLLATFTIVMLHAMIPADSVPQFGLFGFRVGTLAPRVLARTWPLAVVLMASFWSDYKLLYWARATGRSPMLTVLFGWLVLKLVPLGMEALAVGMRALMDKPEEPVGLAGLSPFGSLLQFARGDSLTAGMLAQVGIALGIAALVGWATRRSTAPNPTRCVEKPAQ
ncbi:MAG: hypothetical protein AB1716_00805 [Planctomycetota bacterium]